MDRGHLLNRPHPDAGGLSLRALFPKCSPAPTLTQRIRLHILNGVRICSKDAEPTLVEGAQSLRSQRRKNMPIPESTLSSWSHHRSGTASAQAHVAIRDALAAYSWPTGMTYTVFLQGSYQNSTNLSRHSDVDLVIQLASRLRPKVAALGTDALPADASHRAALERWQTFQQHALLAMRERFGGTVMSGRKTLKVPRGRIPAAADVVVTLKHEDGLAFYLPDERRWVVSYPQRHHDRGLSKEQATGDRFKRSVRMFKAARNQLISRGALDPGVAPSYFIECLLYNVPDRLFRQDLTTTYVDILKWLGSAPTRGFESQSGKMKLFGPREEQWSPDRAQRFASALRLLWEGWH